MRQDYEHLKIDIDGSGYYVINSDVNYATHCSNRDIKEWCDWFYKNEVNNGVFYKGTRLYFTIDGSKYYITWTFYDYDFMNEAVKRLKKLGAENLQINMGELD